MIALLSQQSAARADRVLDALRATFDEPEFRKAQASGPSLAQRILDWLSDFFSFAWDPLAGLSTPIRYLVVFGLLLVLSLLLYHLAWTFWKAARAVAAARGEEPRPDTKKTELLDDLAARAREAARAGDWLGAMRLWFTASVVLLSRKGILELRPGFTHREILARGGAPEADRARLEPLVARLDKVWFGGEPASAGDAESFSRTFERLAAERGE